MEDRVSVFRRYSLLSLLKKAFWVLLIMQFIPAMVFNLYKGLYETFNPKTLVGCIHISDVITDSMFYVKKIKKFAQDPEIKAILLRIDSPGGYAGSCQSIFHEIKKIREVKPVVALIENVGASGGYYIASAAHTVIAGPLSLVGSIGTLMKMPNIKGFLDDWKVHFYHIQTGEFKTAGVPTKEMTSSELAYLQKLADDNYDQFISDVACMRTLDLKQHEIWANGRSFTGNQAHYLKLVDIIGGYSDALDEIKRLIKTTKEIKLVYPKRNKGLADFLMQQEDDSGQSFFIDYIARSFCQIQEKISLYQNTASKTIL